MLIEISCSEDGDIAVNIFKDANKYLAELAELGSPPEFFSDIDQLDRNPMYWGNRRLLIRGDAVVPKPKQVVTEWSID